MIPLDYNARSAGVYIDAEIVFTSARSRQRVDPIELYMFQPGLTKD